MLVILPTYAISSNSQAKSLVWYSDYVRETTRTMPTSERNDVN